MLRTLIESRFTLEVHRESREMQVYDLVLANKDVRPGPGLRASSLDCPVFRQGIPRPPPDPVRWCGIRGGLTGTVVRLVAQGVTMADVVTHFSGLRSVGRPVRDKTGLNGTFDFQIEYAPALAQSPEAGATVFTAIQEQLGLKLQPAKGAVDLIVIDGAEHPATE
jgi:uncharacterized protein (TIGR03435 family)